MKKISRRSAIVVFSLVLVFVFTACSIGGNSAEKAVEKYVEANKDVVEGVASFNDVECELSSRSTSVVYKYTYINGDNLSDSQKDRLEENLTDKENSIINVLRNMQSEESDITSLIFEFYESDGDLILSREYF